MIHVIGADGGDSLIRCAHNGHLKCVEFLIEHGADVNALDLVSFLQLFPARRFSPE